MPAKAAVTGTNGRRLEERGRRQMDLFRSRDASADGAPLWPDLPDQARAALTALMARLIVDHLAQAAPPQSGEASDDV
jgi:hypothetical protein